MGIAAVAIQSCHTNPLECVYIPRAKKHPHFVAFIFKFNAAAPVWSGPVDAARQYPGIHPIQNDGIKQPTDWMHTGHVENTEQIHTNQELVAQPRDIHVHKNGGQSELCRKLVD